jgi:hypothetical protein
VSKSGKRPAEQPHALSSDADCRKVERATRNVLCEVFNEFPYLAEDLGLKQAARKERAKNARIRRRLREVWPLLEG